MWQSCSAENLFRRVSSHGVKDGSIGYHTFSASPIVRGGEVVGLEGFIIDTTERVWIESQRDAALESLKVHSERLEEMVEERTKALCDAQEQL
jgi:hypothetical protein